ncbi:MULTISPECIES: EpsG family protein [Bacillus]|uniref:Capsular biosynthesis protein n=1 Tax=Bacillus cereus TaxID=1396 RepID=A0A2C1LCP6_BACCE|nr:MULTISPECIES: EpsG family protein [Bacillus]PGT96252.1 capsular biosynthesis protein [Bacillus cereus]PGX01835.1 capsular biosynthesis protein [Bacillus sp. AFS033286]
MTILWMNLILVYFFSFFSRYFSKMNIEKVPYVIPNKFLVFCTIFTLCLVSGLRNNIGDTYFYMHSYSVNDFNWEQVKAGKDIGFNIFQMILKKFSNDPQLLILITAITTNTIIVLVLYKYTRMFELGVYVYITSGMYLASMNGIRQYLAAALIFAATKYILDGNWKKYVLVILFASTIHQSVLILIPIYFIVRRRAWSWQTYSFLFIAVLIVIVFNQFMNLLFTVLEDSQYGEYKSFSEGGANIIRVVVVAAPNILAYFGRDKLRELFPKSDYIVNMSILGLVFMIISTQNWIFARVYIYFGLYQLILISWVVKLFAEKDQKLIYYSIVIFYFIFYYYECVISLGGVGYRSYFLNI